MVQIQLNLTDKENELLSIYSIKHKLNDKRLAIKEILGKYFKERK